MASACFPVNCERRIGVHPHMRLNTIKLREWFSCDFRSLALFRILLGILLLSDLWTRSNDILAHYSDFGVIPRTAWLLYTPSYKWSFHALSGAIWVQKALFLFGAGFALALTLGYQTRLATILSWVWLISLQNRNDMLLHGGDTVIRMLVFWGMFLPLNKAWAIDCRQTATPRHSSWRECSIPTLAITLQIVFIYLFSAVNKWTSYDWQSGTAVFYALNLDQFAGYWAPLLAKIPVLTFALSFFVLWFETIGPFLFFSPSYTPRIRCLAIVGFFIMQAGFGLFLELGLFPFVSCAAMVPLIPTWAWRRMNRFVPILGNITPCKTQPTWNERFRQRMKAFSGAICGVFLTLVFLENIDALNIGLRIPKAIRVFDRTMQIHQGWRMFTNPGKKGGWYEVEGHLSDGEFVELFPKHGGKPQFEEPKWVAGTYGNQRWRRYLVNLCDEDCSMYLPYFGEYLWQNWNRSVPKQQKLKGLKVFFMRSEINTVTGKRTIHQTVLWTKEERDRP